VTWLSRPRGGLGLRDLQPHRLADDLLKRFEVSRCRPNLQLRVAAAVELNDDVFTAVVDFEPGDRLRMAAIETLCYSQD
jgi:hypothetical protein